ncbi:MAG: hypothetical protein ACTSPU_14265 [Promethearchaeota archaeon]
MINLAQKNIETLQKIKKNDKEYEILLLRKKAGESVKDLIRQNRNYAKLLKKEDKENIKEAKRWQHSEDGRKWFEESEKLLRSNDKIGTQRKLQASIQMKKLLEKAEKNLQEIMKNKRDYEILLERKKAGENVEDQIKQNKDYVELLRNDYLEIGEEAKEWLKMNSDWFQDPRELQAFLAAFGFSHTKE